MDVEKLIVYSSGATAPPLQKLAETFTDRFGTEFEFTVGRVEKLFSKLLETEEGDILQCGAEYIFDEGIVLCGRWAVQKIKQLQALVEETGR